MLDLLLQKLQQFFEERSSECYLVGGSLRDLLLGQRPQDLDLTMCGDPEPVARALADALKGRYAALNQEKGVKRVILPRKPYGRVTIDLAPMHGASIADDLAQRDFTINALALPVAAAATLAALPSRLEQPPVALIDSFNGWSDLCAGALRVVQEHAFQKDPLRLLRAIRLSTSRQLTIEQTTVGIIHRDAPLLRQVAPERIRDELLQMLVRPYVLAAVRALKEYRLFPSIFPTFAASGNSVSVPNPLETGSHWPTLNAMAALLSAAQGEDSVLAQSDRQLLAPLLLLSHRPVFKKRWKTSPTRAGARSTLLLLAALLADLLPADAQPARQIQSITAALKHLTLGRQAITFIVFLLQEGKAPWQVEPRPQSSSAPWRTARYYFERFGERGIDLAAFSLARGMAAVHSAAMDDAWQTRAQTLLHLIEGYYAERNALVPQPLLDGQVLITRLGLKKGPLIGAILTRVRSAQLDGLIGTRAEALQFITEQVSAPQKPPGE